MNKLNKKSVIVIGDIGVGKSWLLNNLFGPADYKNVDNPTIFEESASTEPKTKQKSEPYNGKVAIEFKSNERNFSSFSRGFDLIAIDTPGIDYISNNDVLDDVINELNTNQHILILIVEYGKISKSFYNALHHFRHQLFLKSSSIIVVINKVPDKKTNQSDDMPKKCQHLFDRISHILNIDLYKCITIEKDPENLKEKINEILFEIQGFMSMEEIIHYGRSVVQIGKNNINKSLNIVKNNFEIIPYSEIGANKMLISAYGSKQLVYADYTASGRSLSFIEDLIREFVLPNYANTHSVGIYASEQTSIYRNDARDIIRKSVNAIKGTDNVIFAGSGSTAAVHKLIGILDISKNNPPIVIVSPYEHHSNYLPWKELGSELLYAKDSKTSSIDLIDLEQKIAKYKNDPRVKIATFTAASNVTGIILDTDKISSLLHKYNFLSFWDYSTAGPHSKIDMNSYHILDDNSNIVKDQLAYKDAVFFSGHKYLGGPQTPGVLIAKQSLSKNKVPHNCGGGTVCYVSNKTHGYLENVEHREEGGTPAITETIRLGLVFKFKDSLDHDLVTGLEDYYEKKGIEFLSKIPNLKLLGNLKLKRFPIFSFLIRNEQTGLYLHHNFVTKLLNDLFGIQSRSGCACAGPYGQELLGINDELADKYIKFLYEHDNESDIGDWKSNNAELFKPGFTRFNLPFFFDESKVDYVLNAIKFVCEHGWEFLPFYEFSVKTGEFVHKDFKRLKSYLYGSLNDFSYEDGLTVIRTTKIIETNKMINSEANLTENSQKLDFIKEAYLELEKANKEIIRLDDQRLGFNFYQNKIRWFLLPSEAYGIIHNINTFFDPNKITPPFVPKSYD